MVANDDHWMDAKLKTREIPTRTREPFPLPSVRINTEFWAKNCGHESDKSYRDVQVEDFQLEDYQSHATIKAPLSN
jgi:thymidylate synthase